MIVSECIKMITDMGLTPVTSRVENKVFRQQALSDSQVVGITAFIGIFQIYVIQNLKEFDKTRFSDDNIKMINTLFVFEDLTKDKETIKIISHGTNQPGKMFGSDDKTLKKILDTFRSVVDDFIRNKGVISPKLKKTFPSYTKAFRFYYETFTKMYE